MRVLENCGKMEVRSSPIEGFGVFAKEDIKAGTLLEEVPFVLFPRYVALAKSFYELLRNNNFVSERESYLENLRDNMGFKHPDRYYFKWHPPVQMDGDSMYTVLPLGFGPVYNTSNTSNNADWKMLRDTFTFRAEKDIPKDSEILTFYGYFLGDDGTIFTPESVFHLAIDMFWNETQTAKVHRVKMLRFGSYSTYNQQKANPSAIRMNTAIFKSADGVWLKHVRLIQSGGAVVLDSDVPSDVTLTNLYGRLHDMYVNPAPMVNFTIEYRDKDTGKLVTEEILWKK